jgi:antirestriction protein ArdC
MTYTSSNTTAPHSNNAAFQSQSPYQQRTTQKDNPTQKLIKQAVDFLLQQLKEGKSETLTAYLAAMARFHAYSFGNILSIARQRPTATHVAGFHAWKELGRFVKRGEKGIQILAPMAGKRRSKNDADRNSVQDDSAKPQPVLIGFRAVYVFDVAQTEGADLPEFEQNISGEVGEHRERLVEFLARQNIALEYNENIAPALGVSYGGKIALLPGQSKAEDFTSLVHETAHLCCAGSYVALQRREQ